MHHSKACIGRLYVKRKEKKEEDACYKMKCHKAEIILQNV
jgi:hypothetical protein